VTGSGIAFCSSHLSENQVLKKEIQELKKENQELKKVNQVLKKEI